MQLLDKSQNEYTNLKYLSHLSYDAAFDSKLPLTKETNLQILMEQILSQ